MVVDEAILWSSLVLLAAGLSLHRMGPSFQRSRFGSPLALLGVASFVLLPEKLDDPESEVYGSIIALVKWAGLAVEGYFRLSAFNSRSNVIDAMERIINI